MNEFLGYQDPLHYYFGTHMNNTHQNNSLYLNNTFNCFGLNLLGNIFPPLEEGN